MKNGLIKNRSAQLEKHQFQNYRINSTANLCPIHQKKWKEKEILKVVQLINCKEDKIDRGSKTEALK